MFCSEFVDRLFDAELSLRKISVEVIVSSEKATLPNDRIPELQILRYGFKSMIGVKIHKVHRLAIE